jgi:hypothetical protein
VTSDEVPFLDLVIEIEKGDFSMQRINREMLERAFDCIKQRPGAGGKQLSYIEAHQVIQRLNDSFDGEFSFQIDDVSEVGTEIVVRGTLSVQLEDGRIIKKSNIGTADIKTNRSSGEVEGIGDTYKSAASDCLKRCAILFGVGLHLYTDDTTAPANRETNQPTSFQSNSLSQAQNGAISAIGRTKNLGSKALDDRAQREHGVPVNQLTKAQASKFIQALQALEHQEAG